MHSRESFLGRPCCLRLPLRQLTPSTLLPAKILSLLQWTTKGPRGCAMQLKLLSICGYDFPSRLALHRMRAHSHKSTKCDFGSYNFAYESRDWTGTISLLESGLIYRRMHRRSVMFHICAFTGLCAVLPLCICLPPAFLPP